MTNSPVINTCLFTGQTLDGDTNIEHTIPESMGGRIRSQEISCNAFNNKCSGTIDRSLAESFSLIYNRLGPLLPSAHSPGNIEVVQIGDDGNEDPGNYCLRSGGRLESHGHWIKKRNEDRRPEEIEGEISAVRRYARKHGIKADKVQKVEQSGGVVNVRTHTPQMYGKEIELAIMKSTLLSFDALLSKEQIRFTRDQALQPIRTLIKDAVMNDKPAKELYSKHVWGIRYDSVDRIHELRKKYGEGIPSDFEHILIACGNAAQETINIVWCIFGFEVHGFRLSWDWEGPDFNYLISSGILKGTDAPTRVTEFASPFELGPRMGLRTVYDNPEEANNSRLITEMVEKRKNAFQRATDLVEMTADAFVIRTLQEIMRSNLKDPYSNGLVLRGIEDRLHELYADRVKEGEGQKIFREIIKEVSDSLPNNKRNDTIRETNGLFQRIDWTFWLGTHRQALEVMESKFGLPGALSGIEIVTECAKFGQLKPAKMVLRKKPKK